MQPAEESPSCHREAPDKPPCTLGALAAIIRRNAPVLYLHDQEAYLPSGVEWYLERATLVARTGERMPLAGGGTAPQDRLPLNHGAWPLADDRVADYWLEEGGFSELLRLRKERNGVTCFYRGRRFASMLDAEGVNVMLDEHRMRAALAEWPAWCRPERFGGRLAAVHILLEHADPTAVRELLTEALSVSIGIGR